MLTLGAFLLALDNMLSLSRRRGSAALRSQPAVPAGHQSCLRLGCPETYQIEVEEENGCPLKKMETAPEKSVTNAQPCPSPGKHCSCAHRCLDPLITVPEAHRRPA